MVIQQLKIHNFWTFDLTESYLVKKSFSTVVLPLLGKRRHGVYWLDILAETNNVWLYLNSLAFY